MKTLLVTGGAGYLGSILSKRLLDDGYRVRAFDRLYFGLKPIEDLLGREGFEFIKGNLLQMDSFLPDLVQGVDAVIHLAGLANDPSCDLEPELTEAVNYRATVELARRAHEAGIERFIFASSCSVYGAGTEEVLTEASPLNPLSLYAKTKVKAEQALLSMASEGFAPVCLRQATLFGLSPRMRFDLAINLMTLHAIMNKKVFILGGGKQWRPFLHLRDACQAFIQCLKAPLETISGQMLNIGSNTENYPIYALAQLVKECLPETLLEMAPEDEDKRSYRVSFHKAQEVIGFTAAVTAREGIEEIASSLRQGLLPEPASTIYYNIRTVKEFCERPALEDGEPVRTQFLPFSLPLLGKEEEDEVLDTLRSGWLTTGPKTRRFEEVFRDYVGSKGAVALASCTGALHLSLLAAGIGPGHEVITSPVTWPSTANVIIHCGAKPVFVDIRDDTLNLDPEKIEQAITERTRAIVPVHLAGQPCQMDEIHRIARKHNLIVIEDAAHAVGAQYRGRMIGSLSHLTCFSFYPIKNITTAEGGMVTSDNEEWLERVRLLSLHGVSADAWKRYSASATLHWEAVEPGFKYNMTDLQASLGLHQLKKLPAFLETRRKYSSLYEEAFSDMPELSLPKAIDCITHAHHLFIIMLHPERLKISRDKFMEALRKENIGTGIHFRSLHLHPYYRDTFGYKPSDLPKAHYISERIISLPLYPKMSLKDLKDVIKGVRKLVEFYKR